jgi:hypothetical protein
LEGMHSLEKLEIFECPKFNFSAGFPYLTCLEYLAFNYFSDMCLPTTIQCLNGLQHLRIYGCPQLEKRCQKETGEDWPKIAHVKHLHISSNTDISGFIMRAARRFMHTGLSWILVKHSEYLVYYSLMMKKVTLEWYISSFI